MIGAYIDGSNLHDDTDVIVVAGCAMDVDEWKKWESVWGDLLKFADLPRWHHTDFMAKVRKKPGEPSQNWREAEWLVARRMLCDAFMAVPLTLAGATIWRKDYIALKKSFPTLPDDPYYFLLDRCLYRFIQGMFRVNPPDDGVIVYCDQDKDEALVLQLARWHADYLHGNANPTHPETTTRKVITSYGSNMDFVPLQAADVLAHEVMRFVRANPRAPFLGRGQETGSFILDRLLSDSVPLIMCLQKEHVEAELNGTAWAPGFMPPYHFRPAGT